MNDLLKAACIQLNNTTDRVENTRTASGFIREAAKKGAQLICTPEYTCQMVQVGATSRLQGAEPEETNPQLRAYRELASELGIWLLVGSLGIRVAPTKLANRSYLLNDKGDIVAYYDKIHLFDVDLPDGQSYRESNLVEAGHRAVVASTPWGGLGMAICYDVRFAYLFRSMAQAGASILTIPAAYSIPTGSTTWEIFMRTRAAETGSFVLAPAQAGQHEGTRQTWGHSMIVGPLGEILAEADGKTPGVITADLDMEAVRRARQNVPAITQDKPYSVEADIAAEDIFNARLSNKSAGGM